MFGNKEATDAAFAQAKHVVELRIEKAPAASAAPTKYAPIWNSDLERSPRILPCSSSASSP